MSNLVVKKEVIQALDDATQEGQIALTEKNAFKRTFALAAAVKNLRTLLTPEVMEPIMELQNTSLGFKTDKMDRGYSVEVVKDCLIHSSIHGVYPVGNMFNIIASRFYLTKEGFKFKLDNHEGLKYRVTAELPKILGEISYKNGKTQPASAIQTMNLSWTLNGKKDEEKLTFPMKFYGNGGEFEAMAGKGYRKAYCWLWNTITGSCLADTDVDEFIKSGTAENVTGSAIDIKIESPQLESAKEDKNNPEDSEKVLTLSEKLAGTPATEKAFLAVIHGRAKLPEKTTIADIDKNPKFAALKQYIIEHFKPLVTQALDVQDSENNK